MTNELWAALIGAVVLLLTNAAGLVKVWSDLAKTKASRAATAIATYPPAIRVTIASEYRPPM
jgi:hypothetical protein